MFSGYWWFAAKTILHAEKIFEYFQVVDDLRLRQFCRWKILWIFSGFGWSAAKTNLQVKKALIILGYWWFAAKTILQAKKSLNLFGNDDLRPSNFAGERDFEYFQVIDDLRPRQFCRWKNLWLFPGCWWSASKRTLQAKKCWNISRLLMICG